MQESDTALMAMTFRKPQPQPHLILVLFWSKLNLATNVRVPRDTP